MLFVVLQFMKLHYPTTTKFSKYLTQQKSGHCPVYGTAGVVGGARDG